MSQSDLETQKHWIHPKKRARIPEGSIQEVSGPGKYPSMAAHIIAYATAGFQALEVEKPRVPWPTGLPVPAAIRQYNRHMGGSDLNAQLRASYSNDRRSKRWPIALFHFIIDASIINSMVVYRLSARERQKITYEKFIEEVALELVNN